LIKKTWIACLATIVLMQVAAFSQTAATKSVLGTVTSFNKEAKSLDVKPENAASVPVKLLPNTIVQRIAPGATNLANASTIAASDISVGDRILVTVAANGSDVLRVVVMSATDIAKRDDADRQDWVKRGLSGIVSAKNGEQILLKIRTPRGDVQQTIAVSAKTVIRRYSPDSVKFADAKLSKLEEVSAGDQIRARGEKSADGLRVDAEEVIFGTFLTKAGSVTAADPASREVTMKEVGTNKTFIIRLTADSTLKQFPAAPDGRGVTPAGGPANVSQIIEALPIGKFEDIKPGSSIVVSSAKGSDADRLTAILLVANADLLIRMASTPSGRGGTLVFGAGDGGGLSVLGLQ
jgi:hypothetical protein